MGIWRAKYRNRMFIYYELNKMNELNHILSITLLGLNQLNNLVNVYSCLLPSGWLVGLCVFLGIDSLVKGYITNKPNIPEHRDFQIRMDISELPVQSTRVSKVRLINRKDRKHRL